MDSHELGAWLRQQRESRCWARSEMARRLVEAAHANGDRSVPEVDHVSHNIYRWERGKCGPSERYRLYYCQLLGITASEFGVGKPEDGIPAVGIPAGEVAMKALVLLASMLGLRHEFNGETLIIRRGKGETGRSGNPDNER
jgi:transcriptional regulator with XRE-family HTH domain